jgi:Uma2 family endonuclease
MGAPARNLSYSLDDYLQLELTALERHEFRNGEVVAMSGGTYENSIITANVVAAVHGRLRGKRCRVAESNLRIRIPRTVLYTYPDASVICGGPRFDPRDKTRRTITNPRVVIEVLSPSTEAYDRGEKFEMYRRIESFEEYVLVAQDAPRVEVFRRQRDGTWLFSSASGLKSSIAIRSIKIKVPLAEIYEEIKFSRTRSGVETPNPFKGDPISLEQPTLRKRNQR